MINTATIIDERAITSIDNDTLNITADGRVDITYNDQYSQNNR